jgi:hypothetical protein
MSWSEELVVRRSARGALDGCPAVQCSTYSRSSGGTAAASGVPLQDPAPCHPQAGHRDAQLPLVLRYFAYMPTMHSEELGVQQVTLCDAQRTGSSLPPPLSTRRAHRAVPLTTQLS